MKHKCKKCGVVFEVKRLKYCPLCGRKIGKIQLPAPPVEKAIIDYGQPISKKGKVVLDPLNWFFLCTELAEIFEMDYNDFLWLSDAEKDQLIINNTDKIREKYSDLSIEPLLDKIDKGVLDVNITS